MCQERSVEKLVYPPMPLTHVSVTDFELPGSQYIMEIKISKYKMIHIQGNSAKNKSFVDRFTQLRNRMTLQRGHFIF